MFGGRSSRRVGGRDDGPVSIPRGERVQLRTGGALGAGGPSLGSSGSKAVTSRPLVLARPTQPTEPQLPQAQEASQGPAWYGQTLEYATGVCLRQQILEPVLAEDEKALPEETARFLSYYSRGDLMFLQNASGAVHVANIERVTLADATTIAGWWDQDRCLPETGSEDWSNWWITRCRSYDPGCEMVKLMGESGETLGVAYIERHVVDNRCHGFFGKRITLIRGLRIHPKLNPETVRRSSTTRDATTPIAYPDVASSLLHYIMFASIRFGAEGVAVNSPKSDTIEDFYQHYFGMPVRMDNSDGRRLFRVSADARFEILRHAFREQLVLMTEYKDQMYLRKDAASEEHDYDGEDNEASTPIEITVEQLPSTAKDTAMALVIPVKKEQIDEENTPPEEAATTPLTVFVPSPSQLEAPEGVVAPEGDEAEEDGTSTSITIAVPTAEGGSPDMAIEHQDSAGNENVDENQEGGAEATDDAIKNDENGEDVEEQVDNDEMSEDSTSNDKPGESTVNDVAQEPEEAATHADSVSQSEAEPEPIENTSPQKDEASKRALSAVESSPSATEELIAEASPPEEGDVDNLVSSAETSPPVQEESTGVETNEKTGGDTFSPEKEEDVSKNSPPTEENKLDVQVSSAEMSAPDKEDSVVRETGEPNEVEAVNEAPEILLANLKRSLEGDSADVGAEIKRVKLEDEEEEEVKSVQGEEDQKTVKDPEVAATQPAEELEGDIFDDA